mgnify:CR=1 FL=1
MVKFYSEMPTPTGQNSDGNFLNFRHIHVGTYFYNIINTPERDVLVGFINEIPLPHDNGQFP